MSKVHDIAVSGFGEGTNELYDRARPSYPAPALRRIRDAIPSSSKLKILEPGSGTGIFSRLLISPPDGYPSWNLKYLIGIEPSAGMRAQWSKGLDKLSPSVSEGKRIQAVEGGFDDLSHSGAKRGEVDAVIIAQAWHWCPDHEKALTEIASYLAPTSPLIFIWNLESPSSPLPSALRKIYEPLDLGSPQYYRSLWKSCFDTKAYKTFFHPPEYWKTEWNVPITENGVVDRLFSKSYLTEAHISGQARIDLENKLRETIRAQEKEWVDQKNGIFNFKYDTDVVIMRRNHTPSS